MFSSLQFLSSLLLSSSMAFAPGSLNIEQVVETNVEEANQEWITIPVEAQLGENEEVNVVDTEAGKVTLTDEQIAELEKVSLEIKEKRLQLIEKYVEFGLVPKEKAEEIRTHMEEHFEKRKQENFLPKWDKPYWKNNRKQIEERHTN